MVLGLQQDPRVFQISALMSLLALGVFVFDFELEPVVLATITFSALVFEWIFRRPNFDPLSPLITALSLCLLLRTHDPKLAMLAAFVAIASKQLIRVDGLHLFNPSALALLAVSSLFGGAWISPGQWGHAALLVIAIVAFGSFVSARATRFDTSCAFLLSYLLIVCLRALYLGDPLQLALHQLSSGALLIFAFFMISDPKTTPHRRGGRMLFAALVAIVACVIEFIAFRPNGIIIALVACAPLVPLINRLLPAPHYRWAPQTHQLASLGGPNVYY